MKIYKLVCILILAGSSVQASPIYLSKLDALCAQCARNKTFRMIRKLGYLGAICSAIYAAARYLNDVRNSSYADQVQFVPSIRGDAPKLEIHASGTVIIRGDETLQNPHIVQELKNPEADGNHVISDSTIPIILRFWRWLITPPHKAFIQYNIVAPSSTKLNIKITHNSWFDSRLMYSLDVSGITGDIKAKTNTGSILVNSPQGKVIATTQDDVTIANFGAKNIVLSCKSIHATPQDPTKAGHVFWNGQQLSQQQSYELRCED
jgi:hypothetical protein